MKSAKAVLSRLVKVSYLLHLESEISRQTKITIRRNYLIIFARLNFFFVLVFGGFFDIIILCIHL